MASLIFSAASGTQALTGHEVVPIEMFVRYGQWFQQQLLPDVESEQVNHLDHAAGRFHLTLSSGEEFETGTVVMASGLNGFAHVPAELAAAAPDGPAPDGLVSHSSQHRDLTRFGGREIAVIGAGQSALESGALLHEAGAGVRVLVRNKARWGLPPKEPRAGVLSLLPERKLAARPDLAHLSLQSRHRLVSLSARRYPAQAGQVVLGRLGAWWLKDRVVGKVPVLDEHRVVRARREGDKVLLTVASAGQTHDLVVDHVLAATGYRVDLSRLDFLSPELRGRVRCLAGWPDLSTSFESSVPGLYFTSLTAAATFGPVMRFVCGTKFTARRVSEAVAAKAA